MNIRAKDKDMRSAASEMMALSRLLRQAGNETDSVERCLRNLSCLDVCRMQLNRQKESIELLTGQLVNLASSLYSIAALYENAETQNEHRLEELSLPQKMPAGTLYQGDVVHHQVWKILKRQG